jgi:hypothetical protein
MRILRVACLALAVLLVQGARDGVDAGPRVSFGYYGPGFSIYVGPRPYYHYYTPYYYRPYYYPYYSYRYYRPYHSYRRTYKRRRSYSSRCSRWSRRCTANWGYRNKNYYGCMRYHRCR